MMVDTRAEADELVGVAEEVLLSMIGKRATLQWLCSDYDQVVH